MGRPLQNPLYIGAIIARLRFNDISQVFSEAFYSSWRGWAKLLLLCLRSDGKNSSTPQEEFWEIDSIASMMSTLVTLLSESVSVYGCPKKSFGYLTALVGSGVLKTL